MGRPKKQCREPFWREARSCWYVQHGTTQIRLSPDKDEAWQLWHEFMARPPEAEPRPVAAPPRSVVEILDAFLDWCSRNKATRTYEHYRENIQRFVDRIPKTLAVGELKPFHVTQAMSDFPDWSNNTKHDFIGALKRALNWALDEELLDRNPLARMKKPAREAREMALSPEEYARAIAAAKEPCFRDLLEMAWETGARVQELRKIEARFVDLASNRIVLPPSKAKGKKHHRVIYLTERGREIVERLVNERPGGPLLVNSDGVPWKKDAINCAFCRLQLALGRLIIAERGLAAERPRRFRKRSVEPERREAAHADHRTMVREWQEETTSLARELGPKYHIGAFRKGFATKALKAGVDTVTVAHLMGHRDPSMVSRVYGHVQQDPVHMQKAMEKTRGS